MVNGTKAVMEKSTPEPYYDVMRIMWISGYSYEEIAKRFDNIGMSTDLVPVILKENFPDLELNLSSSDRDRQARVVQKSTPTKIKSYGNLDHCVENLNKIGFTPITEDYKYLNPTENYLYRVCYKFDTKRLRDKQIDYLRSKGVSFLGDSILRYSVEGNNEFYLIIYEI
jgi:hypothetical protein